jgi:hypothetical protein
MLFHSPLYALRTLLPIILIMLAKSGIYLCALLILKTSQYILPLVLKQEKAFLLTLKWSVSSVDC